MAKFLADFQWELMVVMMAFSVPPPAFALSVPAMPNRQILNSGELSPMKNLILKTYVSLQTAKTRFMQNQKGQDLIEYALMAGFVALAAGSIMPGVATSISTIFSKVQSAVSKASNEG